jgi:RHS repeat-associated protein
MMHDGTAIDQFPALRHSPQAWSSLSVRSVVIGILSFCVLAALSLSVAPGSSVATLWPLVRSPAYAAPDGGSRQRTFIPNGMAMLLTNVMARPTGVQVTAGTVTFSLIRLTGLVTQACTYDTADRLTSISGGIPEGFTYDGHGRLKTHTVDNDVRTYGYDTLDRLTTITLTRVGNATPVSTTTLTYDGLSNQPATRAVTTGTVTTTTTYAYDGRHVVSVQSGTTSTTIATPGGTPLWQTASSGVQTFATDGRGTMTGLVSPTAFLERYSVDGYGNVTATDASGGPLSASSGPRLHGVWYDADSDQYQMGARLYAPGMGRFVTSDPANAGTNWNVYCDGDPVNRSDVNGTDWKWNMSGVTQSGGQWDYVSGTNPNVPFPTLTPDQMGGATYIDAETYRGIKDAMGVPIYALGPFADPADHLPNGIGGGYLAASIIATGQLASSPRIDADYQSILSSAQIADETMDASEQASLIAMERQRMGEEAAEASNRAIAAIPGRILAEPVAQLHDIGSLSFGSGQTWSMTADMNRAQFAAGHGAAYATTVGTAWAVAELATMKLGTVARAAKMGIEIGEAGFAANGLYRAPAGGANEAVRAVFLREAGTLSFKAKLLMHNMLTPGRRWITSGMIKSRIGNAVFKEGAFTVAPLAENGAVLAPGLAVTEETALLFGGASRASFVSRQFFHHELIHVSQMMKNPNIWRSFPLRMLHEPVQLLTAHGAIGLPVAGAGGVCVSRELYDLYNVMYGDK